MKNVIITILSILVLGLGCFIVYDKVINKEEKKDNKDTSAEVIEKSDNKITQQDLYGTYSWAKEYTNEYGNKLNLKINLVLNPDGTATYEASSGYEAESTRGSYIYENNEIVYTREYYNYENGSNDKYDDELSKKETFKVIDKNTLQNTYNQVTELKK